MAYKLRHKKTGKFVAAANDREVMFDTEGKTFKTRNLARQFIGHYGIEDVEVVPASGLKVYRHYRTGKLYELVGTGIHTETEEELVVYRPLYPCDFELFCRPKAMFFGEVSPGVRRFAEVEAR